MKIIFYLLIISPLFGLSQLRSAGGVGGGSPTFIAPALGTPVSGNLSTGTFTWPTFNQNTTGSAGSVIAALTATDASVTFSGSYNGATARTVGLNVGNANSWSAAQTITSAAPQLIAGVNATTAGKIKLFGLTSGDVTIKTTDVAGTATVVTLPNASSTLPIYTQQITWTGATAARTITMPDANFTIARTDAAQTFTGTQTFANVITTNNAITASGNAATVPVTSSLSTVTNNSAATLTITMTTASAVDGQVTTVRILDATAATQTITWVNTENSSIPIPTTSNGSTTLFLTVRLMYNSATSKWRCIGYA